MNDRVLIETEKYNNIVLEITNTASDCLLDEEVLFDTEEIIHTNITSLLSRYNERINVVTKKYHMQSAQSLPKALDALKESIEETDRKAAANIKAKVNK